jgi:hypothetical protein
MSLLSDEYFPHPRWGPMICGLPRQRAALCPSAISSGASIVRKCPCRDCIKLGVGKLIGTIHVGMLGVLDVAPFGRIGIAEGEDRG